MRAWILCLVPLLTIWAVLVADIVRQPGMRRGVKVTWVLACTLVWPLLLAYWLTRPIRGRVELPPGQLDRRCELVGAAHGRESGGEVAAGATARLDSLRPR